MKKHIIENLKITWQNKPCVFTGEYSPGTPDVWYLRNGDPGYPGDPPEIDIHTLIMDDKELSREEIDKLFYDDKSDDNYSNLIDAIEHALDDQESLQLDAWKKQNCPHLKKCIYEKCKKYGICPIMWY